jgi:hypothetical protein
MKVAAAARTLVHVNDSDRAGDDAYSGNCDDSASATW